MIPTHFCWKALTSILSKHRLSIWAIRLYFRYWDLSMQKTTLPKLFQYALASQRGFALKMLKSFSYPSEGFRTKGWEEFAGPDAPFMDFVFTVCDNAGGEACPVWPAQPMTAHWGIEDPAAVDGTDIQKEAAFVAAFRFLKNRISAVTSRTLMA